MYDEEETTIYCALGPAAHSVLSRSARSEEHWCGSAFEGRYVDRHKGKCLVSKVGEHYLLTACAA